MPAMLRAIDHVNIVVRDLDRMVAFYRDVLGLEVTKDVTISGEWIDRVVGLRGVRGRVVYLSLPSGPRIELIQYQSPPGASAPENRVSNTLGIRHFAFDVADLDAAAAKLRQANVELLSEVQRVPDTQVTYAGGVRKRLVYFRDPEGNLLELCEYRKGGA